MFQTGHMHVLSYESHLFKGKDCNSKKCSTISELFACIFKICSKDFIQGISRAMKNSFEHIIY